MCAKIKIASSGLPECKIQVYELKHVSRFGALLCWLPHTCCMCLLGNVAEFGLLAQSSCSLLSYREASFDSSTPAKRQRRPQTSPCGFPAMSTALAWLITCN